MRVDHEALLDRLRRTKRWLSPIWQWPRFSQVCLKLDWLHIADLGVTARMAGSLLSLFVHPPGITGFGATIEDRRLTLWHMLQAFYKEKGMQSDRLKALPLTRFRLTPPILKAQAATVRKIVPWLVQLLRFLSFEVEEHKLVMVAVMALGECYKCLSHTFNKGADYLQKQAAIFGENVASLHRLNPDRYALKPKMHLFQELCSQGIRPSQSWLYREEDFGGSLAEMAHKEGGPDTALSTSRTCLHRYCISASPPSIGAPSSSSSGA